MRSALGDLVPGSDEQGEGGLGSELGPDGRGVDGEPTKQSGLWEAAGSHQRP